MFKYQTVSYIAGFAFSLQLLLCVTTPAALAAPLKVGKSVDGTGTAIETTVPATEISKLKLSNGSVKMAGGKVSVRAVPDWLFDSHQVLDGRLIDSRIATSGTNTNVSGLVYFVGGDWTNNLQGFKGPDNLVTTGGAVLVGRVRAVNADSVDFQDSQGQTKRLSKAEIKSLTSPRAFIFNIPTSDVKLGTDGDLTGDAKSISFQPTISPLAKGWFSAGKLVAKEPKSQMLGTEGGVTKGQLAGMIGLDVFNTFSPAIVAPIVAPLGEKNALNKVKQFNQQEQIQNMLSQ